MATDTDAHDLYQRLMTANQDAFGHGHYGAAYHALAAAMHVAAASQADDRLAEIEYAARHQLEWMNMYHPEHHLASQRAEAQGRVSPYALLAQQAGLRARVAQLDREEDDTLSSLPPALDSR